MEEKIVDVIYTQVGFGGVLLLALVAAFWSIHSDLAKMRVEMAHQMNLDLLSRRFSAYGKLWSHMQPIAIYTTSAFGPSEAKAFSDTLSVWYFSPDGGLFLTRRAREFYFSLQDLLHIGRVPGWRCDERPAQADTIFAEFLEKLAATDRDVSAVSTFLKQPEKLSPDKWRSSCRAIAGKLESLVKESHPKAGELIYASVQQVSSILRSNLTHEVRSRLDVEWPVA